MSRTRTWTLGAVAVALAILLAGWFLLVSPKRSQASDLEAQTTTVQGQNATLTTQIATLKAQNEKLPEQEAKLAQIRQKLPDNPALPGLIRSLSDIAKASGVQLNSLAPANPVAPKTPTTTAPATGTQTTTPATGGVTATTPPASTFQIINVTIAVTGSYFDVEQFFNKVEGMTRSMLVTGFTVAPSKDSTAGTSTNDVDASIQARVFYSPATPTS